MELPPWAPFLAVVLATVLFLATVLPRGHRVYRVPLGPKPWPIIGNLNLIGSLPHRYIHALSKRYGPLMYLQFGSYPVVVGSLAEMARFLQKTQDVVFIDRPKTATGKYTAYNYSDITWSPYGAYGRQARKMCLTELFSAKRLESYRYIHGEEMHALLHDLHDASGCVVLLKDNLFTLSLNVITRMVLGKKYLHKEATTDVTSTQKEFKGMIDEWFLLNGVLRLHPVARLDGPAGVLNN